MSFNIGAWISRPECGICPPLTHSETVSDATRCDARTLAAGSAKRRSGTDPCTRAPLELPAVIAPFRPGVEFTEDSGEFRRATFGPSSLAYSPVSGPTETSGNPLVNRDPLRDKLR